MKTLLADRLCSIKCEVIEFVFCKNRTEYTALPKDEKARVDEIDNCIAELLNVPEVCKTNSDLISRKTALDKVSAIDTSIIPFEKAKAYTDIGLETVKKILQDLPSAMPRTQTAKAINVDEINVHCGNCDTPLSDWWTYCPRCGARLEWK